MAEQKNINSISNVNGGGQIDLEDEIIFTFNGKKFHTHTQTLFDLLVNSAIDSEKKVYTRFIEG